jgi:thiamine-monophosphate kinase
MRIKNLGEIALIKRITRDIKLDSSVVKGPGDDTAVIKWTPKKYLLYTCDMLIEDVHFTRRSATPFQVGWKVLGRNISDIAAMGGVPRHAVVSIALPPGTAVSFIDGLYKGINKLASRFSVNIVGGDVCRSEKIAIDISLLGEVEKDRLATRCGAKRGDLIFVTGSIGGSIRGKHLDFTPRVETARELVRNIKVNSMIDVTDGLLLDLWRILDASKVGARLHQQLVPLSKAASTFDRAVRDGEDFELLFTVSPKDAKKLYRTMRKKIRVPITLIGEVTDKRHGFRLIRNNGKVEEISPIARKKGYLHF